MNPASLSNKDYHSKSMSYGNSSKVDRVSKPSAIASSEVSGPVLHQKANNSQQQQQQQPRSTGRAFRATSSNQNSHQQQQKQQNPHQQQPLINGPLLREPMVLHITNLDFKITTDEWKRILTAILQKPCKYVIGCCFLIQILFFSH